MLSYTALSWNSYQYDNRIYFLETHQNGLEWKWDSNSTLPNTQEVPEYPQPLYSWTHQLNNVPGRFSITRDWNNVKTPGFLSRFILWNKPTIQASIRDLNDKYKNIKLKFK